MENTIQKKLDIILAIAAGDTRCRGLMEEAASGEKALLELEEQIPVEMRDVIWAYLDACSKLGERRLELACRFMEFPYGNR